MGSVDEALYIYILNEWIYEKGCFIHIRFREFGKPYLRDQVTYTGKKVGYNMVFPVAY